MHTAPMHAQCASPRQQELVCALIMQAEGELEEGREEGLVHAKHASKPYCKSLYAPSTGRQKAKRKGKKRSAAEAGLADDSAEAALAALLAGPYAKSDEEWAGEIDTQCAAGGHLDTILEVDRGCLVGRGGVRERHAARNALACASWVWRAALGLRSTFLDMGVGWCCQIRDHVSSLPPALLWHGPWWARELRCGVM